MDLNRSAAVVADRRKEPPRYVAASPSIVESMIAGRIAELRGAQSALDQVAALYRANSLATAAAGVFEIVRGADAIHECVTGMIRSARGGFARRLP